LNKVAIIFGVIIILIGATGILYLNDPKIFKNIIQNPLGIIQTNNQENDVIISNLKIGYNLLLDPPQVISFTMINNSTSSIVSMGLEVDGVQYNIHPYSIQQEIQLKDVTFTTSKVYDIKMTFTMQDGRYLTYTTSYFYQVPKTSGITEVTQVSLNAYYRFLVGPSEEFSMSISNIGDVPIIQAIFTVGLNKAEFPITGMNPLNSGKTSQIYIDSWPRADYVKGQTYQVNVIVTYADGGTSIIVKDVVAS
jgi:hypothetical protein